MALTHTGKLLLGLVASGASSGYEMRQVAGRWTRWFWSASIGGIYPELRRLEAAGLITTADDPRGAQARRTHALTQQGEAAWSAWLRDDAPGLVELRHEGALRLFFADALGVADTAILLRRTSEHHGRIAEELRTTEIPADKQERLGLLSLDLGIALHEHLAAWSAAKAAELEER